MGGQHGFAGCYDNVSFSVPWPPPPVLIRSCIATEDFSRPRENSLWGAKFLPQSSSCLETAEIFRGVLREVVAGPTKIKSHHSSFEHNSNAFPSPAGVDEPRDALLALSHVSRKGQSGHGQQ